MEKSPSFLLMFLLLTAFSEKQITAYSSVPNESFKRGEVIEFKMTYGWFTIGKGSVKIAPDYYKLNDRYCFKVDVVGKTVGMVDWVANVDDKYGAFIDTAALVPHQFYRMVRQGHYKKDEWTNFDHPKRKIEVKTLGKDGVMKQPKYYDAPANVRDMIGGFLYLRAMNLSNVKINDTISMTGFHEDEFYKMNIIYKGKDVVKLKVGKVRVLVFVPVMPKNKVFDGENSITAYFSDDKNRIPVKIDAQMFIGSAGVELIHYSGLRSQLNVVREAR